jgi:ornithine carbamoyltransferase
MLSNLLTLREWSGAEIEDILNLALTVKREPERYSETLRGKTLAMVFQKTSTRTRCSFEVGMTQLGGHAMYLDWQTTNFVLADMKDEAKVLSRYADILVARLKKHSDLVLMAEGSEIPVINGCCEKHHPCQALGDLLTIQEKCETLQGKKIVYIGVHNNVCNSLIVGCTRVGMKIIVVTPEMNPPSLDEDLVREAEATGFYKRTLDVQTALEGADAVYTDTWIDMEFFNDPSYEAEKRRRMTTFMPYQVNKELLRGCSAIVMHCLPAHKGYEITEDVLEGEQSVVYDQAENRLHAQKALVLRLLGKA